MFFCLKKTGKYELNKNKTNAGNHGLNNNLTSYTTVIIYHNNNKTYSLV